jgi:tetratricopeptide (TPR) repeat protein
MAQRPTSAVALTAVLLIATLAAPAAAVLSGGSRPDPTQSTGGPPPAAQLSPRQQAEVFYADGYDEVVKAREDLANGKPKNAEKKLKRALDRGLRATELDTTYHEAWNLVGYASRKLGDYDRALSAYERCLRLKPTYAAAREYLGEAYVELGRVDDAKKQLEWLIRLGASEEIRQLKAAIDAAEGHAAPAETPPAGAATGGAPEGGR